jgi:hypothetical protein
VSHAVGFSTVRIRGYRLSSTSKRNRMHDLRMGSALTARGRPTVGGSEPAAPQGNSLLKRTIWMGRGNADVPPLDLSNSYIGNWVNRGSDHRRREAGGAGKVGYLVQSSCHAEPERSRRQSGRQYHVIIHQWTAQHRQAIRLSGVVLAIVIIAILSRLVLRGAGALRRFLGVNGVNSLSRTMEFLLICIRAQFAIDGVRDLALDVALWQ